MWKDSSYFSTLAYELEGGYRYPVVLKKGVSDVDSEPYPIYGTEDEQEAWCIHHQDDIWGWAAIKDNDNE